MFDAVELFIKIKIIESAIGLLCAGVVLLIVLVKTISLILGEVVIPWFGEVKHKLKARLGKE